MIESVAPNSDQPATEPPNYRNAGAVMLVLAAFLLLCGVCAALFYAINPLTSRGADALQTNTICGSMAGLGFLLGGALALHGFGDLRGKATRLAARVLPNALVFALLFIGAMLIGAGALAVTSIAAYAFPPWHVIAAVATPLAILAYAARRLGKESGARALLAAVTWGALGATSIAILVEVFFIIALLIGAGIFIAAIPAAYAALDQLRAQIAAGNLDAAGAELLSNPWIVGAMLFYFGVIVPPIEEAVKTLIVAFADPRRTRALDAVLWGIGAGVGFAIVENLFNAGVSVSAWTSVMVIRIGATAMHAANGAWMGRAWYAARVERRWARLLSAYVISVVFHAAWNVAAIGSSARQGLGESVGSALVLIALTALGLAVIFYIVRSAARATRAGGDEIFGTQRSV